MTESTPDPQQPPDPKRPSDPEQPPSPQGLPDSAHHPDPQQLGFPQFPSGPAPGQPAANPRPIRASRVWAGIGLAFLGHVVAVCVGILISNAGSGASPYFGFALPVLELVLLAACITVGIIQLRRGDRGIGVGLLVGWAASAIIFAGVCVVLILIVVSALEG